MPVILSKHKVSYPCNLCNKPVASTHKALCCDICDNWVHIKCNSVSASDYELLKHSDSKWFCVKCIGEVFPRSTKIFSDSIDDELAPDSFPSPETCLNMSDEAKAKFLNNLFVSTSPVSDELNEGSADDDDSDFSTSLNCRYYDTENLSSSLKNFSDNSFSLFHLNIASLNCHFDELQTLLNSLDHSFNIIALTETKVSNTVIPENLCLDNYTHFHTPSVSGKGGALLFVNNELNHFSRADLNTVCYSPRELESTFVEMPSDVKGESNIIIGCIYRHPSMTISNFNTNFLQPLLHKVSKENKRVILLGDFNVDLLNHDSDSAVSEFIDNLSSASLLPTINLPTRITSVSKTLIDNIFCNFTDPTFLSGNLIAAISDHLPQFLVTTKTINSKPKSHHTYRDWSNFKKEEFVLDYLEIDWPSTLQLDKNSVDFSFDIFINTINSLIDKHIPLKNCKMKRRLQTSKPWITAGILNSMDKRDKLYKSLIKCKDPLNFPALEARFKTHRNLLTQICRVSKSNYYANFFSSNLKNSKKLWAGINSIINNKTLNNHVDSLLINKTLSNDPKSISEAFKTFYASVAESVRKRIPKSYKHFSEFLPPPNQASFFLAPTDPVEVLKTLSGLDLSKASGPNSVPGRILSILKFDIAVPISHLINLSFSTGVFPSCLKVAKVIPVFKKDSPLLCNNYRPISLLSNLDKIYEKILYRQLYSFFSRHNILSKQQFGFRKSFSTIHALLTITQKLYDALDSGKFATAVFIDLEKAFDTVDHKILLAKLNNYGIRGIPLSLLRSYLSGRSQYVHVSGATSSTSIIHHGVPQGSVLGPLLFLIYINDLSRAIINGDVHHFADDTNLLHISNTLLRLQKKCQYDLNTLSCWLSANKISLNAGKTEYILFKPSNRNYNFFFKLTIHRKIIKCCNFIKYLGVMLDRDLSWKPQIDLVSSKLKRANGILSKLRHYLPLSVLKQVYFALFHSHLSYCSLAWGQHNSCYLTRISTLQNKAARIMTFSHPQTSALPLYSQLHLLRFSDLVLLQNVLLIKDIHSKSETLPSSLISSLNIDFSHPRLTRGLSTGSIIVSRTNTRKFGCNSMRSRCISSWNSLLSRTDFSFLDNSPASLKRKLTSYFIDSY